jgi:hypothetical protein
VVLKLSDGGSCVEVIGLQCSSTLHVELRGRPAGISISTLAVRVLHLLTAGTLAPFRAAAVHVREQCNIALAGTDA